MSAARNDGKKLEYVVALVESSNLPAGFKVDRNSPVFNDDGQQIAELDIVVSGNIGTVTHKTLFECRDRPSQGAQGAEWIEQLVGRRQRLMFDTVVAVSTTGFSSGAEEFAKQANVPLRSVEALTASDVQNFLPSRAPLVYREANFTDVKLVAIPEDQTMEMIQEQGGEHERIEFRTSDRFLRNIDTGEAISILELWQILLKLYEKEIFGDVKNVGDVAEKSVDVGEDIRRGLRTELQGKRGKIEQLIYTATVRMYQSQAPLAYCVSYDQRHVVAHWEGEGADNVTVILTKNDCDVSSDVIRPDASR